jgi:hypothetical protein
MLRELHFIDLSSDDSSPKKRIEMIYHKRNTSIAKPEFVSVILLLVAIISSCGDPQPASTSLSVGHSTAPNDSVVMNPPTTRLTAPKVFYYDYTEQRGTKDAIEMSEADALEALNGLPEEDGNFLGMELSDGNIVQFMYDGNKSGWFLDIPDPETQQSYNADVTIDDVKKIVSDIFAGKTANEIQNAYK